MDILPANAESFMMGQYLVQKFTDADTKQIVFYVPELEANSYGETEEKAREMMEAVLEEITGS